MGEFSDRKEGGQGTRIGPPEIVEIEVTRMFPAKDRAALSHHLLDVGVPNPRAQWGSTMLSNYLRNRLGGDQVVDNCGSRFPL